MERTGWKNMYGKIYGKAATVNLWAEYPMHQAFCGIPVPMVPHAEYFLEAL
jgi:hypothetical protein